MSQIVIGVMLFFGGALSMLVGLVIALAPHAAWIGFLASSR